MKSPLPAPRNGRLPASRVLLAVLAASGCFGSDEPAGAANEPSVFATGADQVMLEVEHYLSRDGVRRGVLHSDTALMFDDSSRVELRRLEIRFFDQAGADLGVLSARSGDYLLAVGDMVVHGDVSLRGRFQTSGPSILEADSLAYDAGADELSTDGPWTLTHADGTVERGEGLVTDPALRNIRRRDWTVTTPDVEVPR